MNRLALCISAAALAASTLAFAQAPMTPSAMKEMTMPNDDQKFMDSAAIAGMLEIKMSKAAKIKSKDPKIDQFASKMIADHTKAAAELAALSKIKKVELPSALDSTHQDMLDDLEKQPAAEKFDSTFKDAMVKSHEEAVSLFDNESKNGQDSKVKAYAAKWLPGLQKHGSMAIALKGAS